MNLIEGWTKKLSVERPRQLSPRQFLHGAIDRVEASNLCLQGGPGAFLVRESRRRPGDLGKISFLTKIFFNFYSDNFAHLKFSIYFFSSDG